MNPNTWDSRRRTADSRRKTTSAVCCPLSAVRPGSSFAPQTSRMLRTRNLPAYRDLLVLFTKYGRKDFHLTLDRDEILSTDASEAEIEPEVRQRAQSFASALKELGPTYVKFGQLLSTRP